LESATDWIAAVSSTSRLSSGGNRPEEAAEQQALGAGSGHHQHPRSTRVARAAGSTP